MSVDRAWQEIEEMQYDWENNPHSFSHQFRCKYALLETNFPSEKFPAKDQTIKRKICQGLPVYVKSKLEAFLEETYPLSKFLERVEHERQFLLEKSSCDLFKVTENQVGPNDPPVKSTNQAPVTSNETETGVQPVNPILAEVKDLAKRVDRLVRSKDQRPWCYNCRRNTHNTRDCWSASGNRVRHTRGNMSPTISLVVNGRQCRALIDTGSSHTVIRESAAHKLQCVLNHRRNVPLLKGITGSPLRYGRTKDHCRWRKSSHQMDSSSAR